MAKLTDTQKNKGNHSFSRIVETKMVCKDPWGRLIDYISFKLGRCPCMRYSFFSFIDSSELDYESSGKSYFRVLVI